MYHTNITQDSSKAILSVPHIIAFSRQNAQFHISITAIFQHSPEKAKTSENKIRNFQFHLPYLKNKFRDIFNFYLACRVFFHACNHH